MVCSVFSFCSSTKSCHCILGSLQLPKKVMPEVLSRCVLLCIITGVLPIYILLPCIHADLIIKPDEYVKSIVSSSSITGVLVNSTLNSSVSLLKKQALFCNWHCVVFVNGLFTLAIYMPKNTIITRLAKTINFSAVGFLFTINLP
jgi:hypothetical protein